MIQRQVPHLGELNTTQLDSWQHSMDVLHEDGQRRQLRLFTDRDQPAPDDPDVAEDKLSSLAVKSSRRFDDLRGQKLKTSRAWALKEMFRDFWTSATVKEGREFFGRWYGGPSAAARNR